MLLIFGATNLGAVDAHDISRHQFTLPASASCSLVVDRVESSDLVQSCWSRVCDRKRRKSLGCGLSALSLVAEVEASRDLRWLAVISVGEGHPILEVVDLSKLSVSGTYSAVREINPYPGTIQLVEWTDKALRVTSEMPLDVWPFTEGTDAVASMSDELRTFRLEIDGWRMVAEPSTVPTP